MSDIANMHPAVRAMVARVYTKALRIAEKALKEPGEEGYDGSGDVKWTEASVRVRASLDFAKKAMDQERETDVGHRQFGLLVLKEKIKDHREWETQAALVDASTPPVLSPVQTTTIDAEVVAPPPVPVEEK